MVQLSILVISVMIIILRTTKLTNSLMCNNNYGLWQEIESCIAVMRISILKEETLCIACADSSTVDNDRLFQDSLIYSL